MGERLKGKVAIVTGSGRGIGRSEAMALAAEGAAVVVNDLGVTNLGSGQDASPADEVVREIRSAGGSAVANYDDITERHAGERIVQQALDTYGRLDILMNNAGIQINRTFFEITEEEWDRTIDIHLKGHFHLCQAAARVFRAQRSGRIINTGSLAGLGQLQHADYCAAKEGIAGFTRALALELGPYGVTVNLLRPRATTRMVTILPNAHRFPQRSPDLVAPFIVYLCSDAAGHINGGDFFVAGNEISCLSLPQIEKTIFRDGGWTIESIEAVFPGAIGNSLVNPAPPQPPESAQQRNGERPAPVPASIR